ncbi:MAG: energy transducer TonB [Nitrospirae bacterium]|nr:MAG: energy transducer TonB [Nitrospirota bacterium]
MTARLMTVFSPNKHPALWWGTLSLGVHVVIVGIFSLIFSRQDSLPLRIPLVHVTLVHPSTSSPSTSPMGIPAQESAPAMLFRNPSNSDAAARTPPTPPAVLAPVPLTPAEVTPEIPSLSPPKQPVPTPRRILRDRRASEALLARRLLQVARTPSRSQYRSKRVARTPLAPLPALSPTIPEIRAGEQDRVARSPSSHRTPIASSSRQSLLLARPPGPGGTSTSKVGLARTIPPIYPHIARESGWEGTVKLRVVVRPDGTPGTIRIQQSSGYPVLDQAAVDAVRAWRFTPAKDGNIPVRSVVDIPIRFDLTTQPSGLS